MILKDSWLNWKELEEEEHSYLIWETEEGIGS